MDHQELVASLATEFPDLSDELNDDTWKGLLHLEVACFARYTQHAIDERDIDTLKKCLRFADDAFRNADANVKNALYVSYLENLDFEDRRKKRRWAFEYMPPALRAGYKEIHDYLDDLFERDT